MDFLDARKYFFRGGIFVKCHMPDFSGWCDLSKHLLAREFSLEKSCVYTRGGDLDRDRTNKHAPKALSNIIYCIINYVCS